MIAVATNLLVLLDPLIRDFERLSLDPNERGVAEYLRDVQAERLSQVGMFNVMRVLQEITICRTVDRFDDYLDRMATGWSARDPAKMADPEAFSRKPLDQKLSILSRACGKDLDLSGIAYQKFREYIEVRHLIDHTGGRVTEKFLSRTGRTDLTPRELFPLDDGYVTDNGPPFVQFVRRLDRALVNALQLPPVTRSELEQLWAEDTRARE